MLLNQVHIKTILFYQNQFYFNSFLIDIASVFLRKNKKNFFYMYIRLYIAIIIIIYYNNIINLGGFLK